MTPQEPQNLMPKGARYFPAQTGEQTEMFSSLCTELWFSQIGLQQHSIWFCKELV